MEAPVRYQTGAFASAATAARCRWAAIPDIMIGRTADGNQRAPSGLETVAASVSPPGYQTGARRPRQGDLTGPTCLLRPFGRDQLKIGLSCQMFWASPAYCRGLSSANQATPRQGAVAS